MLTIGRALLAAAALSLVLAAGAPARAQECARESVTGHVLFFGSMPSNLGNRVEYSFSAVRLGEVDDAGNCRVGGEFEERVHRPDGTLLRHSHGTVVCFTIGPSASGGARARIAVSIDRTDPPLPEGSWTRVLQPDSRLLFRFSALTFNAHRIHYDRGYAGEVEGYPGLVVHGPLTAMLLAQLVQRSTARPMRAFSFRGVAPLFDLGPLRLVGSPDGDQVALQAQGPDGKAGLLATATLA